jgi:hypothetical protein
MALTKRLRAWWGDLDGPTALAVVLDVALRVAIVWFAAEALTAAPNDERFADKGIGVRDLILAGGAVTLAVPLLHVVRRRWDRFPWWTDVAFLSIIALDMAGNSFGLYLQDSWRFDLIPHAYGPAAGLVGLHLIGVSLPWSVGIVNGVHVLLEIQEVFGDVVFGTSNVNGFWDSFTDLSAGLVASLTVAVVLNRLDRRRRRRGAHRSYSTAR